MRTHGLLLALLLAPALAGAQSLQNAILRNSFSPMGAGARAGGMGGAFLAIADDGTAASFNPAGLAQLRRPEFAFVGYEDQFRSRVTQPLEALPVEAVSENHSDPQFVGFALPFEAGSRRLTLQLSYERTVDLAGRGNAAAVLPGIGPDGQPLGYLTDLEGRQQGALHTLTAGAGLDLGAGLMVGASTSFWIGEWTASGHQTTSALLPDSRFEVERETFQQNHSLRGFNLNLGALYRRSWFSLGGVVRLPFAGRYAVEEQIDIATLDAPPSQLVLGMRTLLHWPFSGGAGVALRPLKGLTLAGEGSWTAWETTSVDNVPDGALMTLSMDVPYLDRNFFDLFPASQSLTSSAAQWRLGIEYLLNLPRFVTPLRVGYSWETSPVPDLSLSDGRQIRVATAGFGINFSRVALDFAWQRRLSSGTLGAMLAPAGLADVTFPHEDVTQDLALTSIVIRF